jgi:rRNA processing protein Krr1/Pno1
MVGTYQARPGQTRYRLQVEVKTTKEQQDTGLLQKAADFVNAFVLGARIRPQC